MKLRKEKKLSIGYFSAEFSMFWKNEKCVNINIILNNIVLHIIDKKLRWASASSSMTGTRFSQECASRSLARHVVRSELSAGGIWDFHYLCLFMSLASCAVSYFSDHVLWCFKIISNLYKNKLVFSIETYLLCDSIDRGWIWTCHLTNVEQEVNHCANRS